MDTKGTYSSYVGNVIYTDRKFKSDNIFTISTMEVNIRYVASLNLSGCKILVKVAVLRIRSLKLFHCNKC